MGVAVGEEVKERKGRAYSVSASRRAAETEVVVRRCTEEGSEWACKSFRVFRRVGEPWRIERETEGFAIPGGPWRDREEVEIPESVAEELVEEAERVVESGGDVDEVARELEERVEEVFREYELREE